MASKPADPYKPLFEKYVKELKWAYKIAKERQDGLVKRFMDQQGIDEDEATSQVESSFGPMAHNGHVIYVVRKYWLEVARLKQERKENNPDAGWLEPLAFVSERLEEKDEEELYEMLEEMAYWPIGLNEKDEWC